VLRRRLGESSPHRSRSPTRSRNCLGLISDFARFRQARRWVDASLRRHSRTIVAGTRRTTSCSERPGVKVSIFHLGRIFLVFLSLTLSRFSPFFRVSMPTKNAVTGGIREFPTRERLRKFDSGLEKVILFWTATLLLFTRPTEQRQSAYCQLNYDSRFLPLPRPCAFQTTRCPVSSLN
jgi:hypothetical protein